MWIQTVIPISSTLHLRRTPCEYFSPNESQVTAHLLLDLACHRLLSRATSHSIWSESCCVALLLRIGSATLLAATVCPAAAFLYRKSCCFTSLHFSHPRFGLVWSGLGSCGLPSLRAVFGLSELGWSAVHVCLCDGQDTLSCVLVFSTGTPSYSSLGLRIHQDRCCNSGY